jgi:hypothetical protein
MTAIKNRLRKLETINGDDLYCAESCRPHPEITVKYQHDGVDCAALCWMRCNTEKDAEKPILDICPVCDKPTRKQTIIVDYVTNFKEN